MAKKSAEFPVSVGDTVECVVEDTDKNGNVITELIPYTVYGLAYFKGKYYVLDCDGNRNEIGTRDCILRSGGCVVVKKI